MQTTLTNGTVRIPPDHFAKAVRLQYCKPDEALIREILQNSLDAGAKNIHFSLNDTSMTIVDDGCGMDKSTMIDGMLTFGGSKKDEDSIGGFGLAKEIILFQHKEYYIESKDLVVRGTGLNYSLEEGKAHRDGTLITVLFHNLAGYKKENLETIIKDAVKKSHINCVVTLNDTELTQGIPSPERCIRNLGWCKILVTKNTNTTDYYIHMRYKGLFMFSVYVGHYSGKICVVELKGKSQEILTGTRDAIIDGKYQELQEIINKIIVDPASFGSTTEEPKWVFFRGAEMGLTSESAKLYEVSKRIEGSLKSNSLADALVEIEKLLDTEPQLSERLREAQGPDSKLQPEDMAAFLLEEINSTLQADFVTHLDNNKWKRIPAKYHPEKLKGRSALIVKTWKYCVKKVLQANKHSTIFRIGWTFDDEKRASYNAKEGVPTFLLNPTSPQLHKLNHRDLICELTAIACHEVAHIKEDRHNEYYAIALTTTLTETLKNLENAKTVRASIRKEKL